MHYFNSIKVRLERTSKSVCCFSVLFQFHKGAIRTTDALYDLSKDGYFNSIKVRLERLPDFISFTHPIFQFHKGAIRTLFNRRKSDNYTNFNSIKVRLELSIRFGDGLVLLHFNSIKVRLELCSLTIHVLTTTISIP